MCETHGDPKEGTQTCYQNTKSRSVRATVHKNEKISLEFANILSSLQKRIGVEFKTCIIQVAESKFELKSSSKDYAARASSIAFCDPLWTTHTPLLLANSNLSAFLST